MVKRKRFFYAQGAEISSGFLGLGLTFKAGSYCILELFFPLRVLLQTIKF